MDFQTGYDWNAKKVYSDFSVNSIQKVDKFGIGFGVTKKFFYKGDSPDLYPKLILSAEF